MGYWPSPYGRLNVGDSRRPKRRVVAVLIAHRTPCSDFRLTSHVSHNRTERALQLASQHVVAGVAVLVLPELSSSHVPQGAIVCGWSQHESGPHRHSLQLSSLHKVPPRPIHIENVIHSRKTPRCELRRTAAVSRCVSDLHEKKYTIFEIYPFAARKPVRTCPRGLQGQR